MHNQRFQNTPPSSAILIRNVSINSVKDKKEGVTCPKNNIEAYRRFDDKSRGWIAAYGVAASAFLVSQERIANILYKEEIMLWIILSLLLGATIQIIRTFVYKYISWPLFLGEDNSEIQSTKGAT